MRGRKWILERKSDEMLMESWVNGTFTEDIYEACAWPTREEAWYARNESKGGAKAWRIVPIRITIDRV